MEGQKVEKLEKMSFNIQVICDHEHSRVEFRVVSDGIESIDEENVDVRVSVGVTEPRELFLEVASDLYDRIMNVIRGVVCTLFDIPEEKEEKEKKN